ncbi:MAG: hypothetical protein LBG18_07315, partial [Mediterranea sp.]|nr:hypothetical protein [Mediterranea sp.]
MEETPSGKSSGTSRSLKSLKEKAPKKFFGENSFGKKLQKKFLEKIPSGKSSKKNFPLKNLKEKLRGNFS